MGSLELPVCRAYEEVQARWKVKVPQIVLADEAWEYRYPPPIPTWHPLHRNWRAPLCRGRSGSVCVGVHVLPFP